MTSPTTRPRICAAARSWGRTGRRPPVRRRHGDRHAVTASNLTPDKDTGIGAWTDDEFVRAVTRVPPAFRWSASPEILRKRSLGGAACVGEPLPESDDRRRIIARGGCIDEIPTRSHDGAPNRSDEPAAANLFRDQR